MSSPDSGDMRTRDDVRTDLTGRDRLVTSVVSSWGGHLAFIVAGFILPRMIDSYCGREALGVWDFSWSLVAYFVLVQGGVVSSINRYVAKYRSVGDLMGINRAASSVCCVLAVMGVLVLGLSIGLALLLPGLFGDRLGPRPQDAQWVVCLLGAGLAVQIFFSGYGGVLTGCHRWDIHNAIYGATRVVTVSGMIVLLLCGGGLPQLAGVYLAGELLGRSVRCVMAYRVCPGLSVRSSNARWKEARAMLGFGGKSFVPQVGELLLNQTVSIVALAYLGPAMLAAYSRPRALVQQVRTLVAKFAFVLTPTASSLQAIDDSAELRRFLLKTARWSAYITLPMIVTLAMLGGPLLYLWMGAEYARDGAVVLTVLAVGQATSIIQLASRSVLTGLNAHGRPGLATLAASICAVILAILAVGPLQLGLLGVALAISIPMTIADGIYVPRFACRRLGISFGRFYRETLGGPLLLSLPLALTLGAVRLALPGRPILSLAIGAALGGSLISALYWQFALPAHVKDRIPDRVRRFRWPMTARELT